MEQQQMAIVLVLTTVSAQSDAAALASTLVGERLAACVNVTPTTSTYRWQGALETAGEHQLLIKTTAARLDALQARLMALHPYEVPEVLVLRGVQAVGPYAAWLVDAATEPDASARGPGR